MDSLQKFLIQRKQFIRKSSIENELLHFVIYDNFLIA